GHVTASLDEHFVAAGNQRVKQRIDVLLQQWLTACQLDERRLQPFDLGHDIVNRHLLAAGERVGRIAPAAAEVAGGQPHEHTRPADVRRLALDGHVNLEDSQHGGNRIKLEVRSLKFEVWE